MGPLPKIDEQSANEPLSGSDVHRLRSTNSRRRTTSLQRAPLHNQRQTFPPKLPDNHAKKLHTPTQTFKGLVAAGTVTIETACMHVKELMSKVSHPARRDLFA